VIAPERLASFLLVVTALIVVPGPSVLFVVSRAVALGRRAAVGTAVGNEAGLLVQVAAVALGLGFVVQSSIVVFSAIKFLGALYLVFLGVQTFRHRGTLSVGTAASAQVKRPKRVLFEGFMVGMTNPKGLLIFSAILPQFIDPARGGATLQLLVLGFVCVLIALISDSAWGLLAGTVRTWLAGSARRLRFMGAGAGLIMIGLGVRLALTGRQD
jgi:threonine/homoserine/homoserine lactone efflux protein